MAKMTTRARVRPDGTLAIPKTVQTRLFLKTGDSLRVTLETRQESPDAWDTEPFDIFIGIGKGGAIDGAENHDKYLYENQPV